MGLLSCGGVETPRSTPAAEDAAATAGPSKSPGPSSPTGPVLTWPDLGAPAGTSADGANDAALIVGVEDYLFVPKVPGAAKNATDWYAYLVEGRKVPVASVKLLRNADATKEGIRDTAVEVAKLVKPGGKAWVVFIGHGAPAADSKEGVLVGVDAQQKAASLYARSLRQSELTAALGGKPTVMVLDACFSGRAAGGAPIAGDLQPLLLSKASMAAGMTLLSAGKSDQFAGPLPGLGRPAFSYLVLGALRGWGDANGDGVVTAQEAVDYAAKALTMLPIGRTQTPELGGDKALTLAKKATEKGPSLTAAVVAAPTGGAAGFGEGLGGLTAVPTVQELSGLPAASSLADADVALLDLVQQARRADKGSGSASDKAATWDRLAKYAGKNPYKAVAEKRHAEWVRVGEAEARQREQAAKVCAQHATDSAKLGKLLAMDDDVVPAAQKAAYKAEMARVYAPFGGVVDDCVARERAGAAAAAAEARAAATRGMVQLVGGTYTMGDRKDTVTVAGFWLDVTEVTADAYAACVRSGRCTADGLQCSDTATYGASGKGNHPINCVDWSQATAYCASIGRRLPTEEEWEWAARGAARGSAYPWGDDAPGGQLCWNRKNGTCAVGLFPAGDSPQGVKDLAGNVWEWTHSNFYASSRVDRGGGWSSSNPDVVRASSRRGRAPSDRSHDLGFRCARSLP